MIERIADGRTDMVLCLIATVLSQLGCNHEQFSFKNQGLDQKLTGILPARVVHEVLS